MDLPQMPMEDGSLEYCFGCGENNTIGLKLKPVFDGEKVRATFTPGLLHQGWHNVTHGGIVYSILDEITAYAVLCSGFNFGVTAKSAIRFKHVAPTNARLHASAWATKVTSRLIETQGMLQMDDGSVVAEVDSTFLVTSRYGKAFIWDMDGVLVDSGQAHYESWRDTFAARGVAYSEQEFRHYFGARNDYTIQHVMGDVPAEESLAIETEKERRFREAARRTIALLPGVMPLLKVMKNGRFKLALGTSAPLENYNTVAPLLGIEDYFDVIVTGDDVTQGKPDPQIYLIAAERLDVEPAQCIVFEDSPLGVEAARRAGMKCVGITNTHPAETLKQANRVVSSLEELDLIELIRWI
jgi:HAD superfamily hydrolase (TIGR01509 family)